MNGEEHEIAPSPTVEKHSSNSADNSPHLRAPLKGELSKVIRAKKFKARRESISDDLYYGTFDNPKNVRKGTSKFLAFDKVTGKWRDESKLANEYRAAHLHHGKRVEDEESGSENDGSESVSDEIEPKKHLIVPQKSKSFESFQENSALFDVDDEPPKQSKSANDLLSKRSPSTYARYSKFGIIPFTGWLHRLRMSEQFAAARNYIEHQAPNDSNDQINDSASNSPDAWGINELADIFGSPVRKADFTLPDESMEEVAEFVAPEQVGESNPNTSDETSKIIQDIMNNTVPMVSGSSGNAETWPIEEASDVQDFDVETLGVVSTASQASEEESNHESEGEKEASEEENIEYSHVKSIIDMFQARISKAQNSGSPSTGNARFWPLEHPESLREFVNIENGISFGFHSDPPHFQSTLEGEGEPEVDLASILSSEHVNVEGPDDDSEENDPTSSPEAQSQIEAIEGFRIVRMLDEITLETISPNSSGKQADREEQDDGVVEEFAESLHLNESQESENGWNGGEDFRDVESINDESKSPDFNENTSKDEPDEKEQADDQVTENISDSKPEEEEKAEEIDAPEADESEAENVDPEISVAVPEAVADGHEDSDPEAAEEVVEFETVGVVVLEAAEHEIDPEAVDPEAEEFVDADAEIVEHETIDSAVIEQEVVDLEPGNLEYAVYEAVEQEVFNPEAAEHEIVYPEAIFERGHDDNSDEFDSPTLFAANVDGGDGGDDSDDSDNGESGNDDDNSEHESQDDADFFGLNKSKSQKCVSDEDDSSTVNEITVPSGNGNKSGINLLNMFNFGYLSSSSSSGGSSTSDSSSSQSYSSSESTESIESSGDRSKQSQVVMRYPAPPTKKKTESKSKSKDKNIITHPKKRILNHLVPRSTPVLSNYFEILKSGEALSLSSTKSEEKSEIASGNVGFVGIILGISILAIITMGFISKKIFRKRTDNEFEIESNLN